MQFILNFALLFLSFTLVGCIVRAVKGPTPADRVIAVNVIGTKTIVVLVAVAVLLKQTYFVDVALVYALISFVSTVFIADYLKKSGGEE